MKRHDGYVVSIPVVYHWNGGQEDIVDPPVEPPPGWEFHDLVMGLNMNTHPPRKTVLMVRTNVR